MSATRATITDVASRAGVSHQTVSRVMNDHPNVAPGTREKVLRVIRELDYQPNRAARSLSSQRSATIGVVSFGLSFYGPAQMLANVEQAARARGYSIAFTNASELSEHEIERAIDELRKHFVDGILLIVPIQGLDIHRVRDFCRGVPFALIDTPDVSAAPGASIDQFEGGRLGAEHLLELGHRRIAWISGPRRWHDARLRVEGWQATLGEAGVAPVAAMEGDWSPASGFALTQELLAGRVSFTGLLVGNDQMALGALWALHERGVSVPGQVSVVGFDDIPESRFFHPPLTTVRQDFAALGVESLTALLEVIETSKSADIRPPRVLKPQLIIRASTAPIPIEE